MPYPDNFQGLPEERAGYSTETVQETFKRNIAELTDHTKPEMIAALADKVALLVAGFIDGHLEMEPPETAEIVADLTPRLRVEMAHSIRDVIDVVCAEVSF